jgi:hypothetical protein
MCCWALVSAATPLRRSALTPGAVEAHVQPLNQARARHRLWPDRRDVEFGLQERCFHAPLLFLFDFGWVSAMKPTHRGDLLLPVNSLGALWFALSCAPE